MRYRNDVIRDWHLNQANPHRTLIRIHTLHPQGGELLRGVIRRTADGWSVTDHDGIHHGVHHIDYIEAERVLLDATAALDQITPTAPTSH